MPPYDTAVRPSDSATEALWAEEVKDYYRHIEFYDWAEIADNLRGPETFFHRNRARAVDNLVTRYMRPGAKVLDAGCGTGLNLRRLPAGSTGLDLNPRNVAVVSERLPDHEVVLGDLEDMPFEDDSFGTVLCTEVLEHVPHPGDALREIKRVLVPGGHLIGSVPARSVVWKLRFLSMSCPGDEPFHNEYRPDEVAEMLGEFDIVSLGYSMFRFNVLFVARA